MEIPGKRTYNNILETLRLEGYTEELGERPRIDEKIFEVKNPITNVIMVIYTVDEIVCAFSSKVDHSNFSDPELTEMEEELFGKIIAAA